MAVNPVSTEEKNIRLVQQREFPFPGIPGTADGAAMVVHVEVRGGEAGIAYPITPSTAMGVGYESYFANGFKNVWGTPIQWIQPESEHSAASSCEGYAVAGGRVTNFTSGQGLVLMKEVLYTISGKRLPIVFNIGARALTSHSLNVHAGHDDVMACTDVGWAMLFARNAQEAGDLALISRRAAENCHTPFMSIQDGFLTTHTIENVLFPEDELIKQYLGSPREKIRSLFDPDRPLMSGVVQNQDSYMAGKIAQRYFYDRTEDCIQEAFDEFYRLTGRRYSFIIEDQMEDAEYAIVSIGSTAETASVTLSHIREKLGVSVGNVAVTSFRPFPGKQLVNSLKNCKAIAVLERMDNPLGISNPLTTELEAAFAKAVMGTEGYPKIDRIPTIYSGVAGLGSRDVTPGHMVASVENMLQGNGKRFFSLGIEHPTSLVVEEEPDVRPAGSFSIRGHSVGGYGSVTTNKIIATCLGDIFGLKVQASPKYGSEKKGLPTNTYLTCTHEGRIGTHSELLQVEFVPLMDPNTWNMGNPLVGLQPGGIVFQHTAKEDPQEFWDSIPGWGKYFISENNIRLYGVDTIRIAREACQSDDSLLQRFQGIVLLGVFLRLTPFQNAAGLDQEQLFSRVEVPIRKYFGKRGEDVVQDNMKAVRLGYEQVVSVPRALMEATPVEIMSQGKAEWDAKGKDTNAFFI
ncbi:MAG: 2-oxoacid:acceptor oxidoreductase family protein [Candidatus Melainabacteria bacterium]|nr:2-oxoacid:acceptor oxidoreductase family protein [Candidatus Melainabacteria bacterium]